MNNINIALAYINICKKEDENGLPRVCKIDHYYNGFRYL